MIVSVPLMGSFLSNALRERGERSFEKWVSVPLMGSFLSNGQRNIYNSYCISFRPLNGVLPFK